MNANATMRAVVFDRHGGAELLRIAEVERPRPAAGEVLVEMAAASVNPADWKTREGWLTFFDLPMPFVGGFDGAGRVVEVGEGVSDLKPGDRVVIMSNMSYGQWGCFSQYARIPAHTLALLPDSISFTDAAAMPVGALTSWQAMLENGALKAGETVLVNGGSGATGSSAIQLAKMAGARVAATCGPNNLDYVRELGADLAINYRSEDVAAAVEAFAPGGVDLLLDSVGNGSLPDAPAMVKPGGRLVMIETLMAGEALPDPARAAQRGVELVRSSVMADNIGRQLRSLVEAMAAGRIRPPAIEVLPVARVAEAQERVREGHVRGKLVLDMAGPQVWES